MTKRLSITAKLYLGFLGLLILALVFLGTVSTLWFLRQESLNLDQFLEAESRGISNRLEGIVEGLTLGGTRDFSEVGMTLRRDLKTYLSQRLNRPVPYKTTLLILDSKGQVLAQSNQALDLSSPIKPLSTDEIRIEDVHRRGPAYRVMTASYSLGNGDRGIFRIACPLSSLEAARTSFITSLVVVLAGSLMLFSVLGAGLISLTLSPVRTMSRAAGEISEQNLGARIPLPPGKDDLSRLAGTLNNLLSRLEADYAFQERLVGELTHQLKTPLTILRGRNELGLTTRNEVEDFRELIEDNLSDVDAIVNMLNTLLELARIDSRIDRIRTVPVDLMKQVNLLGEEMDPLWRSKSLTFFAEGPAVTIEADPEGLRQILMNLYDNAWKFAPDHSQIRTSWLVSSDAKSVLITVSNMGPPIPQEDLPLIFKRFFRSSHGEPLMPGAGLGLSIVRSLVELHGAKISAFNPESGGAAFEIDWPYRIEG